MVMANTVKAFIKENFRHFNAASLVAAAEGYDQHLKKGGKMFFAMAGAMSTAELGITLAEMIRRDKIHAISCTGANLEEDLFNLVAHEHYTLIPNYRELSSKDETKLYDEGKRRVTDTCIPEDEAMNCLGDALLDAWTKAQAEKKRFFPSEYVYQLIESGVLKKHYQIDPKNSWVVAACEKKLPIYTPGWEDSTMGNYFVGAMLRNDISDFQLVKSGLEQMAHLVTWYREASKNASIGFFQIGGGIAGDFPICVVPLLRIDLNEEAKTWGYFCQISDSTTSYGSYSGAVPNEKITWGKLEADTPKFMIESDAAIVAPLIFAYLLDR